MALASIAILCLSAWVCLIAGSIAILGRALGLGGAFLAMAAILSGLAFFSVLIQRLSVLSSPEQAGIERSDARLIAAMTKVGLSGLRNKKALKLMLIATSVIAAGLALLLSDQDAQKKD
ncbi:MAG: hypothetical protein ACSHX3_16305 [Litorimonas sp.]